MAPEKPLDALKKGEEAVVAALPDKTALLRKLTAFGILPGTDIALLQTFPSFVLAVGGTRLAMDREIAAAILVKTKDRA